jgi:uncharacterized RDD family membrane protein YckC
MDQMPDQIILDDMNSGMVSQTYAGFWIRFAAVLIDNCILWMGVYLLFFVAPLLLWPAYVAGGFLYYTLLESSSYQGSMGKMVFGLKVVTPHNQRITYGQAVIRFIMRYVSAFILLIGYLMMLWG